VENVRFRETGRQVTVHVCECTEKGVISLVQPRILTVEVNISNLGFYEAKQETPGIVYRQKLVVRNKMAYEEEKGWKRIKKSELG